MSSYKATFLPDGETVEVRAGEMILDAALRHGMSMTFSCRNGTCRSCLHLAVEGQVVQEEAEDCLITPQEIEAGRRLICMSTLRSDAVLEKVKPGRRKKTEEEAK